MGHLGQVQHFAATTASYKHSFHLRFTTKHTQTQHKHAHINTHNNNIKVRTTTTAKQEQQLKAKVVKEPVKLREFLAAI